MAVCGEGAHAQKTVNSPQWNPPLACLCNWVCAWSLTPFAFRAKYRQSARLDRQSSPFSTHSTHLSLRSALVCVCVCGHITLRCFGPSLWVLVCESSPHLSSAHLCSGPCQNYIGVGLLIKFQFSSAILFRNFPIFLHKILQWLLLWGGDRAEGVVDTEGGEDRCCQNALRKRLDV